MNSRAVDIKLLQAIELNQYFVCCSSKDTDKTKFPGLFFFEKRDDCSNFVRVYLREFDFSGLPYSVNNSILGWRLEELAG